jgi:hypothetical protein
VLDDSMQVVSKEHVMKQCVPCFISTAAGVARRVVAGEFLHGTTTKLSPDEAAWNSKERGTKGQGDHSRAFIRWQ